METIERKGRIRTIKGRLSSFDSLPQEKQLIFKSIKKVIDDVFKKNINVYVFGSFYWGFWDEFSDFDVTLDFELKDNTTEISKIIEILTKLNIETDIQFKRGNMGILIP